MLDVDHADEAEAREESAQPAVRPLSHLVRVRGAGVRRVWVRVWVRVRVRVRVWG